MFKGIEQLGRGRNFTKKQTKSVMWNHAKQGFWNKMDQ